MKNDHSCLRTAGLRPNIDHGGGGGTCRTYPLVFSVMVVFHAVPGGRIFMHSTCNWFSVVVVAVVVMDIVFVVIVVDVVAR